MSITQQVTVKNGSNASQLLVYREKDIPWTNIQITKNNNCSITLDFYESQKKYLYEKAALVNISIPEFLPISTPEGLYQAMRHLLDAGGKRLRPCAMMLAADASGGCAQNVLPAAVALELVHNFTLIHDDIMDEADLRRGLPTVHKKWDMPRAIIAGDAMYTKAIEIFVNSKSEPSNIIEGIKILTGTCIELCEGQWMDMSFTCRKDVSEEEYLCMVEKKTASLFAAALKIGATLSGASRDVAQALWDFGRFTGIGFQIYDDVLDLITPEDILGKVTGGDILEGKSTLIVIHAHLKGVTIPALGKNNASKRELMDSISGLKKSGSIDYAMKKAINFIEKGKSALDVLPGSDAKNILLGVADYMIDRRY